MSDAVYGGLEEMDYDLFDLADADDDAEPFDPEEAGRFLDEAERRLEAVKLKVTTPAQEKERQYHLRQIRKDQKQLAEIVELQAFKAQHVKKTLATDIAKWFTDEGLAPGDAIAYLSGTARDEMTFDHVAAHIERLKEGK